VRVVGQNHEGGKSLGIDEKCDALDVFLLGVGKVKRLHDDVLRRNVAHGNHSQEAFRSVGTLQVVLALLEIVRQSAAAPNVHLPADSPAFFGQLVAVGKEPAEAFYAAGKVFI